MYSNSLDNPGNYISRNRLTFLIPIENFPAWETYLVFIRPNTISFS